MLEGNWNRKFVVDVFYPDADVSFHMDANEVIANWVIEYVGRKRGNHALCHPHDHVNYSK